MNYLTDHEILSLLESGQKLHPIDRSLLMLTYACPEINYEDLVRLRISELDRILFNLRKLMFGTELNGSANCPKCHEVIEFTLDTDSLQSPQKIIESSEHFTLCSGGFEISYRLPNILDIARVVQYQDVHKAKQELVNRCFISARKNNKKVAVDSLPNKMINNFAEKISEYDPYFEITLEFKCPACECLGSVKLDIQKFLWREVTMYGNKLLQKVDLLAREYGWSEKNILEMSDWRRHSYINMINS